MQMNRSAVLRFNARHHHVFTDALSFTNQRFHQFAANAFALMIRMDVHRMLHRMTKTIKRTPVPERGVAGYNVVFHAHQHRITDQLAGFKPCNAVIGINGLVVPDRGGVQYRMVIDFADGSAIVFAGMSDNHEASSGLFCSL
ncbi:hypothetical protein D3C75_658060 [compost metagenome]